MKTSLRRRRLHPQRRDGGGGHDHEEINSVSLSCLSGCLRKWHLCVDYPRKKCLAFVGTVAAISFQICVKLLKQQQQQARFDYGGCCNEF